MVVKYLMTNIQSKSYAGNPLGVSGNYERIAFAPYYIFKDLITIFAFIFVLSLFVFFMPNVILYFSNKDFSIL